MNYSVCRLLILLCLVCWNPISTATEEETTKPDEAATAESAETSAAVAPDSASTEKPAEPAKKPKKKKFSRGQTETALHQRLTPAEVEKWVSRLPKVFDKKFREQYRQSLLNGDVPAEPGSEEEIAHKVPEADGLRVDLANADRPVVAPKDTMQERIVNIVEVPSSNTRFVFVERRAEPSPASSKKEETPANQSSSQKTDSMQASQANSAGGLPTIISSRSSSIPAWQLAGTPAPKWDTARAERGFKAFDTYLPTAGAPVTAPAVPAVSPAAKPEPKKETSSGEWKEQIVYIDDEPADEPREKDKPTSGREIATSSWEASVRGEENSFSLLARDTFYSLRKKAYTTPIAGILVNLMLMITGIVLMFLMMAKRRRIATIGYPPAGAAPRRSTETARPAPPPMSYPAVVEQQVQYSAGDSYVDHVDHDSIDTKTDLTAHPSMSDDIRVVFDPHACRWVLKREEYGRLSGALAELQVGTVVRGTALGTNSPAKRYRLSLTNTWIPTTEEEQIIIALKAQNFRSRA